MATPMELALIELQVVARELARRLSTMETRLGLADDPTRPRPHQPKTHTPLQESPKVSHVAETSQPLYDVKPPESPTAPAAPEPAPIAQPPVDNIFPTQNEVLPPIPETEFQSTTGETPTPPPPAAAENEIPILPPQLPPNPPPPQMRVLHFKRTQPPPKPEAPLLEMTLGIQVASWLGALSIMGAILFFLKVALDNGLNLLPAARLTIAAGAGLALVAIGHLSHLKHLRALAPALAGAGIAVLMITAFASFAAFDPPVLSQTTALLLIPIIGAAGIALAYITRSHTHLVISLIGMYLAPYLLQNPTDQSPLFLAYLLALTVAVLLLAFFKRDWEPLRFAAFAASSAWLLAWAGGQLPGGSLSRFNPTLGLIFIDIFFLLFLAEMLFTYYRTLRLDPAQGNPALHSTQANELVLTAHSIANTIVAMAACYFVFQRAELPNLWIVPLALGAIMALAGLFVRGHFFRTGATLQAIALLLLANSLYFNGSMITLTCAILALAFGIFAARFNSEFARAWMFGLLVLVMIRLIAFDSVEAGLQTVLYPAAGDAFTPWTISGWTIALVALLLGWWNRPSRILPANAPAQFFGAQWATVGCIIIATALVFIVNFRALPNGAPFTFAGVLWILALTAFARLKSLGDVALALQSVCATSLAILSIKWFLFDGIQLENLQTNPPGIPFFNFFSLSALAIGGTLVYLKPGGADPLINRRLTGWWLFGLGFGLLNIQTLRTIHHVMTGPIPVLGSPELVMNIAVTLLWALTASVMIAVGFKWKSPTIRYVALGILAVAIVKTLIIDLSGANTLLRVLSFLLTGVLLLLISLLYHKFLPVREAPAPNA